MGSSRPVVAVVAAAVLLLVAAPSASAASGCASANASADQVPKRTLVRATLCVLNAERARHDLRPLRLNRRLGRAARRHSRAMARKRFFSHTSPNGATFVDRIRRTGYLSGAHTWHIGENIAYGSGDLSAPRAIGTAWMNSPSHRENILNPSYKSIGIGIALGTPSGDGGATYTTDFGRRR
jgi:uncharacterized protein YkwD